MTNRFGDGLTNLLKVVHAVGDELAGNLADGLFAFVGQVFNGRFAVHAGEHQHCQRPNGVPFPFGAIGQRRLRPVNPPQPFRFPKVSGRFQVDGFEEQMIGAESDVKGGVAEMRHLAIQNPNAPVGQKEQVFGAVIAVHQAAPNGKERLNGGFNAGAQIGMALGDGHKVGVNAQLHEVAQVAKSFLHFGMGEGGAMERRQDGGNFLRHNRVDDARQQILLPSFAFVGGAFHDAGEMFSVFPQHFRRHFVADELPQRLQASDFSEDAGAVGEPFVLHPQLTQRLLDDDGALFRLDFDDQVGDATAQHAALGHFVVRHQSPLPNQLRNGLQVGIHVAIPLVGTHGRLSLTFVGGRHRRRQV